ncbi:MAG: cation ABC transporter substrate-binding protein [Bacillati bacterium ANGP1]|uniref:Cation ABC transporter substrate-binding protein n=1 Tax=Candidatus Segetimicrobium genomatis TaxID=2569760 RepID=A0A537JCK4_9BACT|nr:MAG: cation ABC transporter substrate-binding protein [Terrabacteria group bacterium ANGP1]
MSMGAISRTILGLGILMALGAPVASGAAAAPSRVAVVAAENFYGDLVGQIGGDHVAVTSIIVDPTVDPHEYEVSAKDGAAVANARLVIQNGLGYDSFMTRLLNASPRRDRKLIVVGSLVGRKDGDNPHVWYAPATMPKLAQVVAEALVGLDPANAASYRTRLGAFTASMKRLNDEVARLRARYAGTPVGATEPVFGYMSDALGLRVLTPRAFQKAVEEGEEPPAAAVAQMEDQLRTHRVRVLLYNLQTVTPITTKVRQRAKQLGIPVVGVTETEPPGKTYQQWMLGQLAQLDAALGGETK